MCSIVGLEGNFKASKIIELLKLTKNRGIDSTGIFLDNKIFLDIDLDKFSDENNYKIALGHNLLSIFNLGDEEDNYEPVSFENWVLVFNGEIYNFDELKEYIKKDNIKTDCNLILNLLKYFHKDSNLLEACKMTMNLLDGDYSFAVWDGENLAICRDPLGVKPLFYSISNDLNAFSSSKYSLKQANFKNIYSLKPGSILYNWKVVDYMNISKTSIPATENIKSKLKNLLEEAVFKRVKYLDEVNVIFSGGVDSTILTVILKEISKIKPLKITLYSVGGENSKDILASKKLANWLELPLKIINVTPDIVKENIEDVAHLIGENNLMKLGVGMTIYLACKQIHEDGGKVAISGQGADELFAGYNRYLKSFSEGKLIEELRHDINNMYHVNLERDDAVSMANSVELRLPFLDKKLVEFALNIPIEYKIANENDKIRKNILREVARCLNIPEEFAYRPKKAAQYGTGIDKILRKKVLKEIDIEEILK